MAGKASTLVIRILADARQASKTFTQAATRADKFAAGMRRAALPAAAVAAGLGVMAKAAADDARAQAVMANNLARTTGATKAQVAAVEEWITATALATGVADDQLRPAMSSLARATGDVTTAQQAMATVLDTAAATGKDTQTVADAVAKAYAGNTTALGRLVPGLSKATLKSKNMTKIMGELAAKTGGAAAAAAGTAAGQWQRATVAFDEAKESIGAGLLPVISVLATALAAAGGWAARNTGTVKVLAIALGSLAAAVLTVNAVMKVSAAVTAVAGYATKTYAKETKLAAAASKIWAAGQWLLNAALTANPIGIVIIVIAALVAAIIIAYKKSETFRNIVQAAWRGIQTAAKATWEFLKRYVFAPLAAAYTTAKNAAGTAIDKILQAWTKLKAGLKAVWDWLNIHVFAPLRAAFDKVVNAVQKVIDWISKIKIPGPVQWLIDKGASLFTAPAPPAPTPRTPTPTSRSAAGDRRSLPASAGGLVVNVFLDGKKVGGYFDRIVTSRLEDEGFALAAGAWGS